MAGFVTCRANEVVVISGCFRAKPKLLCEGTSFVIPGLQKAEKLSTNNFTVKCDLQNQKTKDGVPINIKVSAMVKIQKQNEELLRMAVETLLTKSENEIKEISKSTMDGLLGTVVSEMTAEEIMFDKKKFSKLAFEKIAYDLINMGLVLMSVLLMSVGDDQGFYKKLQLERIEKAKEEQVAKGNHNSFVARYDEKRKEFESNKEKGMQEVQLENKNEELSPKEATQENDRVEKTYTFSENNVKDMYQGYDWGSADNKYV